MVGRPKKYFTEEERIQAIQQCKNKYLRNTESNNKYLNTNNLITRQSAGR